MPDTKRRHIRKADANVSLALKQYHASRSPEHRAAWRLKVSAGTSIGMAAWHSARAEAEREGTRRRQADAAVCAIWRAHRPGTKFQKGHRPVGTKTPEALARRDFARVKTASVKRILKDIVGVEPDLVRAAIIEGISAPPPRSFPYIALAAAYLDGKPIDAEPPIPSIADLSELTSEQLQERAALLAAHFRREVQVEAVIDVVPVVVK